MDDLWIVSPGITSFVKQDTPSNHYTTGIPAQLSLVYVDSSIMSFLFETNTTVKRDQMDGCRSAAVPAPLRVAAAIPRQLKVGLNLREKYDDKNRSSFGIFQTNVRGSKIHAAHFTIFSPLCRMDLEISEITPFWGAEPGRIDIVKLSFSNTRKP